MRRKRMLVRQSLTLFVAVLAATNTLGAQSAKTSQPVVPAFEIAISLESSVVKAGSKITVKATLVNKSSSNLLFSTDENIAKLDFKADVRDSQGNLAPLTEYGRSVMRNETAPDITSAGYSMVRPGETKKSDVDITKLYNLSQPGKYSIRVQRIDDAIKMAVKSNTITLTVTP